MGQAIGELAVVGQDQQPRCIEVEPPNAVEPRSRRMIDEIDCARSTFGVAVGADGSARLEEHDVDMLLSWTQRLSVHLDAVDLWIGPGGQRVHRLSVDRDRALEDQCLAFAPSGDARVGEDLLEALAAFLLAVDREGWVDFPRCGCTRLPRTAHPDSVRGCESRARTRYPVRMPIYEYESKEDGEVIELMRPMKDADALVVDPKGKGRTFCRKMSVFGVSGTASSATSFGTSSGTSAAPAHIHSSGCGCGRPRGSCGN